MKYICEICKKKFKREYDLNSHIGVHTPYWKGRKVVVSGGDQICLLLKDMHGGWKKYQNWLTRNRRYNDLVQSNRIRSFERRNKISFVVCGTEVKRFRSWN